MPRVLSGPTSTATAKRITQPGYLFQAAFPFPIYYSSRSDVTWNGHTFIAANLKVGTVAQQADGSATLQLAIGNSDGAFGAICLAQDPHDVPVSVWKFYEGATAAGDPLLLFSGSIDAAGIAEDAVTLTMTSLNRRTLFIPRRRFTPVTGFNHLLPAGRVIEFGGLRIDLERDVN